MNGNEQIYKLIDGLEPDAFMTYKGYLYHANDPKVLEHSDPEPLYTRQELEKFAELIVRECINKISQEQDIAEQNWQCKNGLHICHELTKHFEVEE
jgi:hypothetical protein